LKIVFNILGTVFLGLGILGIFLPLMPGTVFLLLAAACYLRGSERFYHRLVSHHYLGPYIRNFQDHRAMPFKAKVASITMLWVSLSLSALLVRKTLVVVVLCLVGVCVTVIILSVKTLHE
jgi:hypothetical protein